MAKDIQLNTGTGGDRLKAKELETDVKHQQVLIDLDDGPGIDAFGRLRVSQPHTLFSSKLIYADDAPLLWDKSLETGAGITASTPTLNKPYVDFTSTLNTAGKYTRQTFRCMNYQPGKSQLILMTGVLNLSGGGTGVERRIGMFTDDNGAFFEEDNSVVGVTVRSKDTGTAVDTTVAQTAWNLDNLDGDGDTANPSGITADWTKAQIFVIDFQWLSVGRIRFGLEIAGKIIYVHEVNSANTSAIPWTSGPNLPLRYQIITTASSPASTMRVICASVISEGGEHELGVPHSESTTDHVNANAADTIYALIGVRLKAAGIACTIDFNKLSILAETSDNFEWLLILNPTVAGTFTYSAHTNSCVEVAIGDGAGNPSTNTVTGGTILDRGFGASTVAESEHLDISVRLGAAIDGTKDEIVLVVRPLTANADILGALGWIESV